jgi:hypothetical protein
VDFPDLRGVDDWEQHKMFQTLISGVSKEAAEAIARRKNADASSSLAY